VVVLLPAEDVPVEIQSRSAILIDATTGSILFSKNPEEEIPPASLAKLMTIHIALSEVQSGNASLDEIIELPPESWAVNQPPHSSLMFLAQGQTVTLQELLVGLAVPSGNDAAVAVALRFAPTVADFAERMNAEARTMGLEKTHFVEPSGISEFNTITAGEYARFCSEYIHLHPEALTDYHSVKQFSYPRQNNVPERNKNRPGTIVQTNHNSFIRTFDGADGLKTGYIDESGYNIAVTAERNNTRLIAVVLGGRSTRIRDADCQILLDYGFANYKTFRPEIAELEPQRVWFGEKDWVELALVEPMIFTVPASAVEPVQIRLEVFDMLKAPVLIDTQIGDLVFSDEYGEVVRTPVFTKESVRRGGFFKQFCDYVRLFFLNLFHIRKLT
jgi:D-alanyl-D-alanine carboxypeptidase (penicillin-binding protein 5/6)